MATMAPGWTATDETFGARLALVRQRMQWNVTEAARECGINQQNWRLWEQGREPHRMVLAAKQIAARTGCDYLWLVHGPDRGGAVVPIAAGAHATDGYPEAGREGRVLAHREVQHGDGRRQRSRVRRTAGRGHPVKPRVRPLSPLAVA